MKYLSRFRTEEDGAVSVDWVVITALVAAFAALIASSMQDGGLGLADGLKDYMSTWSFAS